MNNQTKALYLIVCIALTSLFFITNISIKDMQTPVVQYVMPQKASINQIIEAIEKLPESAFKSNLYIIIATEYAGDGDKLNEILQEWSRLQVDQLKKAGKLSL